MLKQTNGMNLLCRCDHCPNNTCTIVGNGACYVELSTKDGSVRKEYNCFNQPNRLVQSLICDPDQSQIISQQLTKNLKFVKCCNSSNYCTDDEEFQSSIRDRERKLESGLISPVSLSDLLPISLLFSGLLLIVALALVYNYWSRRRRTTPRHHGDENYSENSSGKVHSDAAVYDTNSMASREPLINGHKYNHQTTVGSTHTSSDVNGLDCGVNHKNVNPISLICHSNSLNHPHRGPWIVEESYNGKASSTFQMSIGSGDTKHKQETSTGSGSGQPYLTQRSIAHDIELLDVVGRGYYGVVWRGEYKGEPVAVKIFSAMAEPSWEREAEIYQTTLLRHKNILGFIATDKRDDVTLTGYWLVTDYYPMGSLYDFLKSNSMSIQDAVRMAFSIANGLSHLHVEIFGTQGKPAIAHRDLKSKNILVKNDGTCCIADLGMAVRYNSNTGIVDVPANTRVGTRRYLAPELLDNKLNLMDFEAVKATDVYALGLVLWEVLRRTCYTQPPPKSAASSIHSSHSPSPKQQNPSASSSVRASPGPPPEASSTSTLESVARGEGSSSSLPSITTSPPHSSGATPTPSNFRAAPERLVIKENEDSNHNAHSYELSATNFNESIETSIDDFNNEIAFVCDPYEAPYQQFVTMDPSAEEMRQIVCVQKIRPPLSMRWTRFAPMRDYTTLMRECWYEKPQARLSALRIRKTLGDIARHYFDLNMEYD